MKPESNSNFQAPEEELDIKKVVYLLLRQWYWFLLFGVLGTGVAIIYNRITVQQYSVNSTVLIPEKSSGLDMKSLFEGTMSQPGNKILNQVEILKSYYTINQTLLNLNWRTSWYKKENFVWREIYSNNPLTVEEPTTFINPKGIPLQIKTLSNDRYELRVEAKGNEVAQNINFTAEGYYNRPFVNEYFNFTLVKNNKETIAPNQNYRFVFNDLNNLTQNYQKRVQISLKEKSSDIILCAISGQIPSKECEFINELIKVYISSKMKLQDEAQRRSLLFIDNQLSGISETLDSASKQFTDFRSKNQIIDIGNEGQMVMEKLTGIESERSKSQMQLDYFQNLLDYLNRNSDYRMLVAPSVVGIQDLTLNALVAQLSELYTKRQVISFSAKENNPALLLIDNQLNQTRSSLIENVSNLIDNSTYSITSLSQQQNAVTQLLNKLPQKEQQMINIQRQFDLTNEIYTFLLQKRAEINISLASSIPDVNVIDIARPETATPLRTSSRIILLLGFVFGLLIPAAFLVITQFFNDRIRTQDDVERNTQLPILGNIMHSLTNSDLPVYENPKSNIAESFRSLRTNMQFMLKGEGSKVISVHSTSPSEGKSFISINLATILAMNDKKVLLIGGDLRKPRGHKILGLKNEVGLSTFLIGYHSLKEITFPTPVPNLSFIPSGPIPPNPAEILNRPEMASLIDQAKQEYDFIVIDNAPVGLVTDGVTLSQLSDLNIFILRFGVSYKHQLEMINQFAEKGQIKEIALVVNDIKTNSFGYTYYHYYQYEYYQNAYYSDEDQGLKRKKTQQLKGWRKLLSKKSRSQHHQNHS